MFYPQVTALTTGLQGYSHYLCLAQCVCNYLSTVEELQQERLREIYIGLSQSQWLGHPPEKWEIHVQIRKTTVSLPHPLPQPFYVELGML